MLQLFKSSPNKEDFIDFIKTYCSKERNYYKITNDVYKQLIFKDAIAPYLEKILPHYHTSKQFYITRKLSYSRFITIIRHICKQLDITYTSTMKYANSSYQIDYFIYIQ
jgi:hypothetical protein